jgi:hypothetical protein
LDYGNSIDYGDDRFSNNISGYGNSIGYGSPSSSSMFGFGDRIDVWHISTALALAIVALATCLVMATTLAIFTLPCIHALEYSLG